LRNHPAAYGGTPPWEGSFYKVGDLSAPLTSFASVEMTEVGARFSVYRVGRSSVCRVARSSVCRVGRSSVCRVGRSSALLKVFGKGARGKAFFQKGFPPLILYLFT
jgi:hypothetical protein